MSERGDEIAGWFERQAQSCQELGSSLWAGVLPAMAQNVRSHGVIWEILETRPANRFGDAAPLRLLGQAHRMALAGEAPELAAVLPSCGGQSSLGHPPQLILDLMAEQPDQFAAALTKPPQTNEVARAAGLIAGLLAVSQRYRQALRLCEVGCSGGLNLRMDHFRYQSNGHAMGPTASPVQLIDLWDLDPGFQPGAIAIVDRAGCDPDPVDVLTSDGARWLESFVWPDQAARRQRLRGAIELAARVPAAIEQSHDTAGWLRQQLDQPTPGVTTVVYHSIVWQYIEKDQRAAITAEIVVAGTQATHDTPLVWMMFEPDSADRSQVAVTLRMWPGDVSIRLASADFHGRWVKLG